tara:strand:+ start:447 stop:575 length:129 start_codon:yes stop_codon:yes gene_type:complete
MESSYGNVLDAERNILFLQKMEKRLLKKLGARQDKRNLDFFC